jgi:predicted nicotinamide N-methyase
MMKKLISLAAGATLLALASTANAAQPVALTDGQMDGVTAGGVAIANGASLALGEVTAETATETSTNVDTVFPGIIAIGQSFSQALATGGFLFQAAAISHADTAAHL